MFVDPVHTLTLSHTHLLQGIAVPEPLRQLTTSEVLVTRWVEGGEKLAESTASDVRALWYVHAHLQQHVCRDNQHSGMHCMLCIAKLT
jgi:hypothetical protein